MPDVRGVSGAAPAHRLARWADRGAALGIVGLLCACSADVAIGYVPTVPVRRDGPARIETVLAADERGYEAGAYWLGTIRGGFGNPLKSLTSLRSVSDVVADAVEDALEARRMVGGGDAPTVLSVTIERLSATQYLQRDVEVDLAFTLRRRSDGATIWRDRSVVSLNEGSVLSPQVGVFGSANRLRQSLQRGLDGAIDKALDQPGLRATLLRCHPYRPPPPPPDDMSDPTD